MNLNPEKLVSIITVNYNQPVLTEKLLASILNSNLYSSVEIIVVDNASLHDPITEWQKRYPGVIFVRSENNRGFAGGNNLGIGYAKGEYLFFINNDTEITPGLISDLVNTLMKNSSVGIISPKIHYYDKPGIIQYAGYTAMNYITGRNACLGQFEFDSGQYDHSGGKTGYAHGAAMMVTRAAVNAAGMMAENFFLYYEELDWCERIKKAGFAVHISMSALIYHKESMSVGKNSPLKEYYMNRNRILFIRKHATKITFLCFMIYFIFIVAPRNILTYIKHKEYRNIVILGKAITWNFTNKTNSTRLWFPQPR